MMIATREIQWGGRRFLPGDTLPDDPLWARAWLEAGSARETPAAPPAEPAPEREARPVMLPGEEVQTQSGMQVTDRLPEETAPKRPKRSRKKAAAP